MLMLAMTMLLFGAPSGLAQEINATVQQASPPAKAAPQQPVQASPAPAHVSSSSPAEPQVVTLPAGTKIPLTLANPIMPKSSRRGDSLRAVTAFPVTAGGQVAIPDGVYVEGKIEKLVKKDRFGHPWVEARFTRLVFPNGYVLELEAQSTEAYNAKPVEDQVAEGVGEAREPGPSANALESSFQQPVPPLQPLPKPNYGPAIGIAVGGAAAAVAVLVFATRHRYDNFFYDVGWQFDMVLQTPLKVDVAAWNADVNQ